MSHQHLTPGSSARGMKQLEMFKMGLNVETLGADKDVDVQEAPVQAIDPGGAARNVDLPDVSASDYADDGMVFVVLNTADAAETITVRDAANADASVGSVPQNGLGVFVWDSAGGQWLGNGAS